MMNKARFRERTRIVVSTASCDHKAGLWLVVVVLLTCVIWFWLYALCCFSFLTCEMSSIKGWFTLALGLAKQLNHIVFRQLFAIKICHRSHQFAKPDVFDVFIFSSTCNWFLLFGVVLFPLVAFVSFPELSHKNAWINYHHDHWNAKLTRYSSTQLKALALL